MTTDSHSDDKATPAAMHTATKRTCDSESLIECESLPPRRRAICRGEVYGESDTNSLRERWGLPPLQRSAVHGGSPKSQWDQSRSPLWKKAVRFASAATKHILSGRPKATPDQISSRLEICKTCDLFGGKHCKECGCACDGTSNFMNKLAWADQECPHPAGPKWGKLDGPA